MPSHYCKCGHCENDPTAASYYKNYLQQTKLQTFHNILSLYVQGLSVLYNIKKSTSPEEGKLIQKIRTEIDNLVINLKKENISNIKEF